MKSFWRAATALSAYSVLVFLLLPIIAVIPLSFNSGSFLSYPLAGFSGRWYADVWSTPRWWAALDRSLAVAAATTVVSSVLGTAAAIGLSRVSPRLRATLMALFLAPMIVPTILVAIGIYFFFVSIGLVNTMAGLVIAHVVLATPFVLISVDAGLRSFDRTLLRAAESLGASPWMRLRYVLGPAVAPAIGAGAIFAFATSFDEVVLALFLAGPGGRTLPLEMLSGVRENLNPAVMAVATSLVTCAAVLLASVEWLRARSRAAVATAPERGLA